MPRLKQAARTVGAGLAVALLMGAQPASAADDTGDPSGRERHGRDNASSGRDRLDKGEEVFVLLARTAQNSFIDVDGSGELSQGDEFINGGALLRDDDEVGTYGEVCTLTRTAPGDEYDMQCLATLKLSKGTLTLQSLITFTGTDAGEITFAINGGTGRYRKARGFVDAVNISDTETRLTVHLSD
ncbi:hypothetical protein ABZ532_06125 [Streptomyces sp. NPDC019396]|uniref:allene oxide cyclase barrel-like domain-containing protein n=1 Tax=Streptomyces sp. NPDC019396 TaxID=3154687 RepID=UPI0033F590D2